MPTRYLLRVAVPSPIRRLFDYLPPADSPLPEPGQRLRVPFGHQQLVGVVVEQVPHTEDAPDKLKAALASLDTAPLFDPLQMAFCRWAARYYQYPLGEVLSAALPAPLRNGDAAELPSQTRWQITIEGLGLPEGAPKGARKQAQLLTLLRKGTRSAEDIAAAGFSKAVLKALTERGLVEAVSLAESQTFDGPLGEAPLPLNAEQAEALAAIPDTGYCVSLLDGVTGSGKTEVYLQAIQRQLEAGRQALVLVPEIGLTPQTVARFQRRFKVPVGILHSGVADGGRNQAWLRARAGLDRIIIGTRSAVFAPLKHPGIIIVDEEHDTSYKQQEGFRYSARDLAVYRAHQLQVPLVMGSATPSLESLANVAAGRYQRLRLRQQAANHRVARLEPVDIRNQPLQEGLSNKSLQALKAAIQRGEQVLVFINRRGFAPLLMCHFCGWQAKCPRCDARMTLHHKPYHLHCHHCDHQRRVPQQCPDCKGSELHHIGAGTERTEAYFNQILPDVPVLRIDRDSTRSQKHLNAMLDQIQTGAPCVLVGTQMLAKGHHFPRVSTVIILDADGGLFSPDFRATEKMAQLIIQVAGRAGREDLQGQVLLQSHHTEHPYLNLLLSQGYHGLARQLLQERQLAELPPFSFMVLLRAESKRPENAQQFLQQARQQAELLIPANPQFRYLGPLPAAMEKRQDRFRFLLQLQAHSRAQLQQFLPQWIERIEQLALSRRVRWAVDVDPQETH
ncbi:primosomal protein N' [Simiduia aestuariiviva]|uniref:Replication restart protein PriA n=1 Tax=Simiduia aestuariiviva TaxID=1510459 RepID=A0A839UNS4_9GAMM|nr:primosomal protein N' [Simiduia aestuariiviva]MBB3167218.1 primosomal protein N' (replication factor Y) [Simiduia aestuariiviva]